MRKILVSGFALLSLLGTVATIPPANAQQVGGIPFTHSDGGNYGYDNRGKGMDYGKGKPGGEYGERDRNHRDDYGKRDDNSGRYTKDHDCKFNCDGKYTDNLGPYGKGDSDRDWRYNKYNNSGGKLGNGGYDNGNRGPVRIRPL
jgi:hypothetical protein